MAKPNRWNKNQEASDLELEDSTPSSYTHQNNDPDKKWASFEQCWVESVKNGNNFLMESCKMHLKSKGWLDDQSKWIYGIKHFGIPVEK